MRVIYWKIAAALLLLARPSLAATCDSEGTCEEKPPNIIVFIVDDLGHNQVGYYAKETGNHEISTPNIDHHATKEGIIMDRAYTTHWCGPTRAAFQTGRFNSFNLQLPNSIYSFDDDIGHVGGLQPGIQTIPLALKETANYATSYHGKWGIGGTSWSNTPVGVGYDSFHGFWGDSIESCDGHRPFLTSPQDIRPGSGGILANVVPGYWTQGTSTSPHCDYFQEVSNETLSQREKDVACQTTPLVPPKLIDQDLLDQTVKVIESHDYDSQPLFHVHAMQLMHLPMEYPKEYDRIFDDQPDHFQDNVTKPTPTNDDLRLTTRNAMRFVDDVYGRIVSSLKARNQWDNSIVLFTSDNGGAIYWNSANNNYPLRGAKFTPFEGGLRVPQFLSGGWLDQKLGRSDDGTSRRSSTYMYIHDWAPTLLEMAGGKRETLLGDKRGSAYGSSMWQYIANSVTAQEPVQKPRKVTYAPFLMMDVQENKTMKMLYSGDSGLSTPRHWSPNFPQMNESVPDLGYQSLRPCRPGGKALKCCYFNIEDDPFENEPLDVDCDALFEESRVLHTDEAHCEEFPTKCMTKMSGMVPTARDMTLWSQYGASGPFVNSSGYPVGKDLPMKCICDVLQDGIQPSEVTHFIARLWGPSECIAGPPNLDEGVGPGAFATIVRCDGSFQRKPQYGVRDTWLSEGISHDIYDTVMNGSLTVSTIWDMFHARATRKGHTEWAVPREPYIGTQDSCVAKGVTGVPVPGYLVTPWCGLPPDANPTAPDDSKKDLCVAFSAEYSWCPSKQNPLMQVIESWEHDADVPFGAFVDGSKWLPIKREDCERLCAKSPEGTAFISSEGPLGLSV